MRIYGLLQNTHTEALQIERHTHRHTQIHTTTF